MLIMPWESISTGRKTASGYQARTILVGLHQSIEDGIAVHILIWFMNSCKRQQTSKTRWQFLKAYVTIF